MTIQQQLAMQTYGLLFTVASKRLLRLFESMFSHKAFSLQKNISLQTSLQTSILKVYSLFFLLLSLTIYNDLLPFLTDIIVYKCFGVKVYT